MGRMLDESSPDVLHLWEEPWSAVAAQAVYLCQSRGIALVLETDQNILRAVPFPFQQLRRYTLARTDLLIARQQEALDVSRAWGYSGPAEFVEYVVDRDCFRPLDVTLAKHSFNVEGFTIGYVGRLIREKGLFTILDGLARCRQKVNFLMMGSGNASNELRQRIHELGLTERVRLLDPQPPPQVALFMNSLSALVLMSETTRTWKEQFGRVIIEAQACGVPVIGSSSGSIPAVVGKGGWIVEEANSQKLAELLDDLASNPSKLADTSIKAADNLKRFSMETVAGSLHSAWLGAVRSKNGSRKSPVSSESLARPGRGLSQAENKLRD
jgi:glycosyltransferase involved in cell wall biosynthesis